MTDEGIAVAAPTEQELEAAELPILAGDTSARARPDWDGLRDQFGPKVAATLAGRFVVPPFSVLDARADYWQNRKRAWLGLGIESEVGRGGQLVFGVGKRLEKGEADLVGSRIMKSGGGTSIFDPVLCELIYRWFSPPTGEVLDPFAGGSVRGIVATRTGRVYTGIELRAEQVAANRAQSMSILGVESPAWQAQPVPPPAPPVPVPVPVPVVAQLRAEDYAPEYTPVERRGDYWLKRDDLFRIAGVRGGKVRTCWNLAQGSKGLITAGSRASPQVNIVAHIAARLGIPCRVHTPSGEPSPEVQAAIDVGAELEQHTPGHNSVIVARARADWIQHSGWTEIPFGMECQAAVQATAKQLDNLIVNNAVLMRRIVVPVGSGMSLAGILHGIVKHGLEWPLLGTPVIGVIVGADPTKRLDKYAPPNWRDLVQLVKSELDYHAPAPITTWQGVKLDPHYEAKCLPFMEPGDLLWCVGLRQTMEEPGDWQPPINVVSTPPPRPVPPPPPLVEPPQPQPRPQRSAGVPVWVEGDSTHARALAPGSYDLVFTCPPYADLEKYSDDPRDLSNMPYPRFVQAYRHIIKEACTMLKDNRFAVVVVGEVRDPQGNYRDFVGDTVQAFRDAGLAYYNEIMLVTPAGSLPVRAGVAFAKSRKIGKSHQQVLVFLKGNWREACAALGLEDDDLEAPLPLMEVPGAARKRERGRVNKNVVPEAQVSFLPQLDQPTTEG